MNVTTITFGKLQATTGLLALQELRAALAICAGLANKEIARALDCAPGTVKKTIERLFFKLGVSSRSALVAEAFRRGLVSFAGSPTPEHQRGESHDGVFVA
ncbi:response regulator transcription factor [Pseudomonas petrae]|uniref:response regulator transcription factor n=1 Tax=Pseudomonas petrae TaxID=2912190 RepID=UPI001EFFF617|nr:LuxR C-terminal-related transcriptional regulator [Pseudomonas petrae]MCF7532003.1 LuxR C-terminal-related transcriptional regulator [Pseudomonas petrae]